MMNLVSETDHLVLLVSCFLMVPAPHLSGLRCVSAVSSVHVFSGFLLLLFALGVHSVPPIGRSRRRRSQRGKSYKLFILIGTIFETRKIVYTWTLTLDCLTARFGTGCVVGCWTLDIIFISYHFSVSFQYLRRTLLLTVMY